MKLAHMEMFVEEKFKEPELRQWLLATGDAKLVEGNQHGDRFWGVYNDVGENHLGRILMKVRGRIQQEESNAQ